MPLPWSVIGLLLQYTNTTCLKWLQKTRGESRITWAPCNMRASPSQRARSFHSHSDPNSFPLTITIHPLVRSATTTSAGAHQLGARRPRLHGSLSAHVERAALSRTARVTSRDVACHVALGTVTEHGLQGLEDLSVDLHIGLHILRLARPRRWAVEPESKSTAAGRPSRPSRGGGGRWCI